MDARSNCIGIYDHCYKGSNLINIESYFKDYKNLIAKSDFSKHFKNYDKILISNTIGSDVDEEKYNILVNYCSIDKLTVDGELEKITKSTFEWSKDPSDLSIIDNLELQTVKDTKIRNLLKNHEVHLKYRSEKPITYEAIENQMPGSILSPESDILVFVRVYVPFTSKHKQSTGVLGKLTLNCVIAMYGSQTLDKLKDKITCVSDYSVSVEMSKIPVRQKTKNAKDVYKSGFFFIENTFYNDCRDSNNKDISKVIRDWAEHRFQTTYKTAKMEKTRIDSLKLRFGFPWVYQHQGDCEHLISFSDARFVNASDELYTNCYPRIVRIKPKPNHYCMTCGMYSVNWITTSNSRLPHNPCFFCDSCFKSYNYIKGKKVGDFQAYPYPYDSSLLQNNLEKHTKMKPTVSNMTLVNTDIQEIVKLESCQMDTS